MRAKRPGVLARHVRWPDAGVCMALLSSCGSCWSYPGLHHPQVVWVGRQPFKGAPHLPPASCLDPCTFWAWKAVDGWKQLIPRAPNSCRPITFQILARLVDSLPGLCTSPYKTVLFWVAFTIAFFRALRVWELVANFKLEAAKHPLGIQDVSLSRAGVTLTVKGSKMNQRVHGAQLQGDSPCPWQTCKTFLAICLWKGPPLFIHRDGSFLLRYQFTGVLQAGLAVLGLPLGNFIPHSFRTMVAGLLL